MVRSLRRRSHAERKALAVLRGEDVRPLPSGGRARSNPTGAASVSLHALVRGFMDLRRLAAQHGLAVQPPSTPFIAESELLLLSWLAEAQRVAGPATAPDDPCLVAAIARCAGMLEANGLRLAPLTLYSARLFTAVGEGRRTG